MSNIIKCSQCGRSMLNTDAEKKKHVGIYHPEVMEKITLITHALTSSSLMDFKVVHSVEEIFDK